MSDLVSIVVILVETRFMTFKAGNFMEWVIASICFGMVYMTTSFVSTVIFNRREFIAGCRMIMNKNVSGRN